MSQLDNSNISVHLGKSSQYKSEYDASLLVREPRQSNRTHLGISDDNLPFVGYDAWNAYEVSGLTDTGVPVVGVAKIVYTATNKYIVESKSIKLYFNSFNMTKLGKSPNDVRREIAKRAAVDLSNLLETTVMVKVFDPSDLLKEYNGAKSEWKHDRYLTLEDLVSPEDITCDVYSETPGLLDVVPGEGQVYSYHSALLKSNCRVTSQPDWGDVYISYSGPNTVTTQSLLKYIISFRDECHFHEEICETIYKRLLDLLKPDNLVVKCLYVRRGGIDICPERANKSDLLDGSLSAIYVPHVKTPRQ